MMVHRQPMHSAPRGPTHSPTRSPTRSRSKLLLLVVAGCLAYIATDRPDRTAGRVPLGQWAASAITDLTASADAAVARPDPAPVEPIAPAQSIAAPRGTAADYLVYPRNPLPQAPPSLYLGPLPVPVEPSPAAAPKPRMAHSSITTEAPRTIGPPENTIPLLGPELSEGGWRAAVSPPFLTCTVEVTEHGVRVSQQSMGCTQSGDGDRPFMLMEFGQEVPNEIPNMKYWLSMQVEGYRKGYPVIRTRMELKGLLGRAVGRRKYESMTIVEPNRKQVVMAFSIDDDEFAVTIVANKQE